jgi:predicted nucleotidyltransferase component of viral defense system
MTNSEKNFLFKGGTCLMKNYLGYFRFSEDVDFAWKDQGDISVSLKYYASYRYIGN